MKWYGLRQRFNQSVQEYTTEFQNQAMILDIDVDGDAAYMKYFAGLNENIRRELKLFDVSDITDASIKAIAIEGKTPKSASKPDASHGKGSFKSKADGKTTGSNSRTCTGCKKPGHTVDKCWEKFPDLKPDKLKKKGKTTAVAAKQVTKVIGLTEPLAALTLMTKKTKEDDLREQLFVVRMQIEKTLVDAIVDNGSQKNLISAALVEQLGLETHEHPKPYPLSWIQKENDLLVQRQCTFTFALGAAYVDTVVCDVVPLDVCQVILGSPYLWDRDAVLFRKEQRYELTKDGRSFEIQAISSPIESSSLISATQAKRMVNASKKFVLLMIRPVLEPMRSNCMVVLTARQADELAVLK